MENLRNSAILILFGSILFIIAAVLPYTRVFIETDTHKKLAIIQELRLQWNVSHIVFILASLLTSAGLSLLVGIYARALQTPWAWFIAVSIILGALLWIWDCVERLLSPESFVFGTGTPYLFLIFSILTMIGLFLLGILILKAGLSAWVGWMLMGAMTLVAVLFIIFKDVPPIVYFIFTLILGIRLLTMSGV